MGWTSYNATNYKNGKIDRVKEVEDQLKWGEDCPNKYTVLKSALVGSTVYSAIERTHKETGERQVFATIFLTSTNMKDYYNFSYKDMDETCGPNESKCPLSILKLLTPINQEWANSWRERCYKYHASKKSPINLNKFPIGTKIKMPYWDKEKAEFLTLIKTNGRQYGKKNPIWISYDLDRPYKYSTSQINSCGFEVISKPE
jgi:hypothetical protein